jgi:predicted phage tail protein
LDALIECEGAEWRMELYRDAKALGERMEAAIRERNDQIAALEAETQGLRERLISAEYRAGQKIALCREVEDLLGVPHEAASDEQLRIGVETLRRFVTTAAVERRVER